MNTLFQGLFKIFFSSDFPTDLVSVRLSSVSNGTMDNSDNFRRDRISLKSQSAPFAFFQRRKLGKVRMRCWPTSTSGVSQLLRGDPDRVRCLPSLAASASRAAEWAAACALLREVTEAEDLDMWCGVADAIAKGFIRVQIRCLLESTRRGPIGNSLCMSSSTV
jgi:hypothetical protein